MLALAAARTHIPGCLRRFAGLVSLRDLIGDPLGDRPLEINAFFSLAEMQTS
jgi:hypothetical protein